MTRRFPRLSIALCLCALPVLMILPFTDGLWPRLQQTIATAKSWER